MSERDNRPSNRPGNNTGHLEDEAQDPLRNEEVAAEAESDTEFNFHEAETESDSDDNQSTQDAQRSVQTGATAGSDTGEELSYYVHVLHAYILGFIFKIVCFGIFDSN